MALDQNRSRGNCLKTARYNCVKAMSPKCVFLWLGLMNVALLILVGCGKQPEATVPQGMATQGAPFVVDTNSGVDLAELNREVKRWMAANQKVPSSFEDFAVQSKVTIPPAPAGKKYVLSKEMRVVLVDH